MSKPKKTPKARSGVAVAMFARYGKTNTMHGDRRMRRAKDAKKSWRREEW